MIPIVIFPSILPSASGGEDDFELASILINEYEGLGFATVTNPIGKRVVIIPEGQQAYKINFGSTTAGTSDSLHLENTNVNYQTTGTAKVILIIQGGSPTVSDFEIIEDSSADAGTGTVKEDFPSIALSSTRYITTKELSFAASKFITIKVTTGTSTNITDFVIE